MANTSDLVVQPDNDTLRVHILFAEKDVPTSVTSITAGLKTDLIERPEPGLPLDGDRRETVHLLNRLPRVRIVDGGGLIDLLDGYIDRMYEIW